MSANNELLIYKKDEKWEIVDKCVEFDIETHSGFIVDKTNNLEDAIDIANEYMKENEVEYGITFSKNVLQGTNPNE